MTLSVSQHILPMKKKKASRAKDAGAIRLTTIGELKRAGFTAENRPTIVLDPARVPMPLRALISLAEQYGISDDTIRADVFRKAGVAKIKQLKATLYKYDDAMDDWLAGPEALSDSPTEEYVAFSAMRMGADFFVS